MHKQFLWCLCLAPAALSAQVLADDFSGASIDPSRWSVVTAGVPFGGTSVAIASGRCALTNRGHLVSAQQFDPSQVGPIRVRGTWTWTDGFDRFQVLLRSDGVPSGTYGETANGIELLCSSEGAGPLYMGLGSRGANLTTGPLTWTGGFHPVAGVTYTFEIIDRGSAVTAHIDGPNGQTFDCSLPVLSDTTTVKKVVFHNREATLGSHTCHLDDVTIESLAMSSTYTLLPSGLSWDQANAQAQVMGGHLAVIDNQVESDWLRDNLLPPNASAWIGARKVAGVWTWVDGSPFAYSNWDVGQPDNFGGNQDRARMWSQSTNVGTWDDTDNNAPGVYAIVELPLARWSPLGSGCVGTNGIPLLSAQSRPVLGQTFTMAFGRLPTQSGLMIGFAGFAAQTTSLASLGMPACFAEIVPAVSTGLAHSGSTASWPVSVPANLALGGLHVFLQAAVQDAPVGTVTNAIDVTLGF